MTRQHAMTSTAHYNRAQWWHGHRHTRGTAAIAAPTCPCARHRAHTHTHTRTRCSQHQALYARVRVGVRAAHPSARGCTLTTAPIPFHSAVSLATRAVMPIPLLPGEGGAVLFTPQLTPGAGGSRRPSGAAVEKTAMLATRCSARRTHQFLPALRSAQLAGAEARSEAVKTTRGT